jgi:hypothetical protein
MNITLKHTDHAQGSMSTHVHAMDWLEAWETRPCECDSDYLCLVHGEHYELADTYVTCRAAGVPSNVALKALEGTLLTFIEQSDKRGTQL